MKVCMLAFSSFGIYHIDGYLYENVSHILRRQSAIQHSLIKLTYLQKNKNRNKTLKLYMN